MARLDADMFEPLAHRFKALAEPARLRVLDALRQRALTVGELVERTALHQANVSKHLQLLHGLGFVERWKEGLFVYYRLADTDVFQLCDIMCGRIARQRRTAGSAGGRTATRLARRPRPRIRPAER